MATNQFKTFATSAGANVTSQVDWEALPALLTGFQAGKASSAQVNKAIRQASFIAAALAQYTANKSGSDVLDDGNIAGFITKMSTAFGKDYQALDATLTALAALATGANKLPYFTGADTAAQTDLTSVGRDVIGQTSIANLLAYLTLGTAAQKNIGVGAGQVPDMSAFPGSAKNITNGYFQLPSGFIVQYGTYTGGGTGGTINFPFVFPNSCRCVTGTRLSLDSSANLSLSIISTASNFTWACSASIQFAWMAVGG